MKKMPPMSPSMLLLIEDLFAPQWNKFESEENNGLSTEKQNETTNTEELQSAAPEERPHRKHILRLIKSSKKKK